MLEQYKLLIDLTIFLSTAIEFCPLTTNIFKPVKSSYLSNENATIVNTDEFDVL